MRQLRQYIKQILKEYADSAGEGYRYVYRGMELDMQSSQLASAIRKFTTHGESYLSEGEVKRFLLGALKDDEIGIHWSQSEDVARNFANVWGVKSNRGPILHVIFRGKIPNDAGYDPQAAGEEFIAFADEAEIRLPKGTEIEIEWVKIYIHDNDRFRNIRWKFQYVTHSLGKVKA
tara:strand:+ start:322 stop:846 length:525 start_codon:yes stop_codon:yes gene_type:complete